MLLSFTVAGFKAFADPATLSLVASGDKDLRATHTVGSGLPGELGTALSSAVLVGANASGKTSFFEALLLLIHLIQRSRQMSVADYARIYRPNKSKPSPTELSLELAVGDGRFVYHVAYDQLGVGHEKLLHYAPSRPRLIFERTRTPEGDFAWAFGASLNKTQQAWRETTRETALFLSTAIENNLALLEPLREWCLRSIFLSSDAAVNIRRTVEHLAGVHGDKTAVEYKRHVLQLLQAADLPITDLRVEQQEVQEYQITANVVEETASMAPRQSQSFEVSLLHSDGEQSFWYPLGLESSGTRQLFSYAGPLFDIMANGGLLVVDEFSARLSTVLCEHMLDFFHHSRRHPSAQLLVTTHDSHLLDLDLVRRDQIWFVEQVAAFASTLTPLTDFSPRKGEAVPKNYLAGRYGGIARPKPLTPPHGS